MTESGIGGVTSRDNNTEREEIITGGLCSSVEIV